MNKLSALLVGVLLAAPFAAYAQDSGYQVQQSISFAPNSAKLSDAAEKKLRQDVESLSVLLRYRPDSSIEIGGYSAASEKKPGPLADARAQKVWEYLISQGLPAERMEPVGHGATPGKGSSRVDIRITAEDALAMSQFSQPVPAPAPSAPAAAPSPEPQPAEAPAIVPAPAAPVASAPAEPSSDEQVRKLEEQEAKRNAEESAAAKRQAAADAAAMKREKEEQALAAKRAQQEQAASDAAARKQAAAEAAAQKRAEAEEAKREKAEQAEMARREKAEQAEAARQARLKAAEERKAAQEAALERKQAEAELKREQQEQARMQARQNAIEKKRAAEEARKAAEQAAIQRAMNTPPPTLTPEASDKVLLTEKGKKIVDNQTNASYVAPPSVKAPSKSALPGEGSYFIQGTAYFSANARSLTPGSSATIDALAIRLQKLIQARPNVRVDIVGHADPLTEAAQADVLAEGRAEELMKELVSRGVDREHLHPAGAADTQPLTSKKNDPARNLNMRAEIRVPTS